MYFIVPDLPILIFFTVLLISGSAAGFIVFTCIDKYRDAVIQEKEDVQRLFIFVLMLMLWTAANILFWLAVATTGTFFDQWYPGVRSSYSYSLFGAILYTFANILFIFPILRYWIKLVH